MLKLAAMLVILVGVISIITIEFQVRASQANALTHVNRYYFSGSYSPYTTESSCQLGSVMRRGYTGGNSPQSFINAIRSAEAQGPTTPDIAICGTGMDGLGARYIVRRMIGQGVGIDNRYTRVTSSEWASFEARIRGTTMTTETRSYAWNGCVDTISRYWEEDIKQFRLSGGTNPTCSDTYTGTVFRVGGQIAFIIDNDCVNPVGDWNAVPSTNFTLTPVVGGSPTSTESGSGTATVRPTVTNGGTTSSTSAQWQVSKFTVTPSATVPGGSDNGSTPVQHYGNGATTIRSGSQVFSKNQTTLPVISEPIGDYPVGTKVCYALSVKPFSQSSSNWRHGVPYCIVIAKMPKIQIHGGDLRVGANFVNQAAGTGSFIRTGQSIKTSGSPSTARTFGSWSEYGVIATGVIAGLGSGSAFAGPGLPNSTQCSYSFLTFTNGGSSNCADSPVLGGYISGVTLPDIATTYPATTASVISGSANVSSLNGVYRTNGAALTITGGTLPAGRTVVINTYSPVTRSYGDVTISGNISYASDVLEDSDNIPQLILIAGNIGIRDDVSQIDSWLVARGVLNTCVNILRTAINSTNCQAPLTINGPVMANQVNLWRTGGSGTGAASGDPAEVFNLRPDAYLWGIAQSAKSGRLDTVYERELPPRY